MQAQLALPLGSAPDRLAMAEDALLDAVDRECGVPSAMVRRFLEWHRANPHVYSTMERLLADWRRAGHRRCGIKALWERARWELHLQTSESPRLNNSYTSLLARLLELHHPEWSGTFEMRRLRG